MQKRPLLQNPWWIFVNILFFITSFEVLPDRWWLLAQLPIFSNLPCQYACFVVSLSQSLPNSTVSQKMPFSQNQDRLLVKTTIIDMPLLSSCFNFCKICHFRKTAICQDAPVCHLILIFGQTLWWIFGTLAVFAEICLFCINFSFSNYNRHAFVKIPLFFTSIGVLPNLDGFLPNSPFSQICHFRENRQLWICLFSCLSEMFCQTFNESFAKFANFAKYHFRKTHNYRHASFVILLKFLLNFYKFLPNFSLL